MIGYHKLMTGFNLTADTLEYLTYNVQSYNYTTIAWF